MIPEVTGLIQETWREDWSKKDKTKRIFYVSRCYRYERPQKGRYREFTQFGVEYLGAGPEGSEEVQKLLADSLAEVKATTARLLGVEFDFNITAGVKRGLSYYVEDGFEAECASLGAQKQIAGGGRYAEGVGWAIGVDRLVLAMGA
jgi:histidyl-tRNA synthetase